jgi:hypothetical protein
MSGKFTKRGSKAGAQTPPLLRASSPLKPKNQPRTNIETRTANAGTSVARRDSQDGSNALGCDRCSCGYWGLLICCRVSSSAELGRTLARQGPPMPEPTEHPHYIVMLNTTGYGLARMYQIVGELTQPLVSVVRTVDEALAALGFQSAHFEPLEQPQLM